MQEFIDYNYPKIFERIRNLDPKSQYAACLKFLDLIRPYFCQVNLQHPNKYLFRVRLHPAESDKSFYFTNVSDLSYRTDFFNITTFGRCNCPLESIFYCSDDPRISFLEVTDLAKSLNFKVSEYHTTGVWKVKQPLSVSPIFENRFSEFRNERLMNITLGCLDVFENFGNYSKKQELKEFHRLVGYEFVKDFSSNPNIYLISSAISNYLLHSPNNEKIKIDGLIYPTCIRSDAIRKLGLNYAFDPCIIGLGNKINFFSASRSKVKKLRDGYHQTEVLHCKKVNIHSGEISW